jgi:hypothetical protein
MTIIRRVAVFAGFGFAVALIAAGATQVAAQPFASAAPISGGVLQLVATPGVLADSAMQPGDTIYWPIDANLNASTGGDLTLRITSSDALASDPAGLRLALARCSGSWNTAVTPPTCNGTITTIIPDTAFADIDPTHVWHLGKVNAVSSTPMIASIALPGSVPSSMQGASAAINFGFTALGDTEDASPSDPAVHVLGLTGIDPTGPVLLCAGLLLGGLTLALVRSALVRRDRRQAVDA